MLLVEIGASSIARVGVEGILGPVWPGAERDRPSRDLPNEDDLRKA